MPSRLPLFTFSVTGALPVLISLTPFPLAAPATQVSFTFTTTHTTQSISDWFVQRFVLASSVGSSMRVHLHLRDKTIAVECGDGQQCVRWLASVAVARYDDQFGKSLGTPTAVQKEGGVTCDMNERVCDVLENNQHVFIVIPTV